MNDVLYTKLEKTQLGIIAYIFPKKEKIGGTSYFRCNFVVVPDESQSNAKCKVQAGRHEQTAAKECQHHIEDNSQYE